MLKIKKIDNSIVIEGINNNLYPDNGTITFPLNSIEVVADESDIITFKSAANGDVLFSSKFRDITINGASFGNKETVLTQFNIISNAPVGAEEKSYEIDYLTTDYTVGSNRFDEKYKIEYLPDPTSDKNYTHTFGFDKTKSSLQIVNNTIFIDAMNPYESPASVWDGSLGTNKAEQYNFYGMITYKATLAYAKDGDTIMEIGYLDYDYQKYTNKLIYKTDGIYFDAVDLIGMDEGFNIKIFFPAENNLIEVNSRGSGLKYFSFSEHTIVNGEIGIGIEYRPISGINFNRFYGISKSNLFNKKEKVSVDSDTLIDEPSNYIRFSENRKSYILTKDNISNALESGTDIKTINGESLLGQGNIVASGKPLSFWLPKVHSNDGKTWSWYGDVTEDMKAWNKDVITKFNEATKEYSLVARFNNNFFTETEISDTYYPIQYDGTKFNLIFNGVYFDAETQTQDNPCYAKVVFTIDSATGDFTSKEIIPIELGGGSSITVDAELNADSVNPVQNKIITSALQEKGDVFDVTPLVMASITQDIVTEDFQTALLDAIKGKKLLYSFLNDMIFEFPFATIQDVVVVLSSLTFDSFFSIRLVTTTRKTEYIQTPFDSLRNTVDFALKADSENPVQNKVITAELNKKVESVELTQAEYDQLAEKKSNVMYVITDAPEVALKSDLTNLATKDELNAKADASSIADMATQTWVTEQINAAIASVNEKINEINNKIV